MNWHRVKVQILKQSSNTFHKMIWFLCSVYLFQTVNLKILNDPYNNSQYIIKYIIAAEPSGFIFLMGISVVWLIYGFLHPTAGFVWA